MLRHRRVCVGCVRFASVLHVLYGLVWFVVFGLGRAKSSQVYMVWSGLFFHAVVRSIGLDCLSVYNVCVCLLVWWGPRFVSW